MASPSVPKGRIDLLAEALLKQGLKLHGDPTLRTILKMAEPQVRQALSETLGPETKAGKAVKNVLDAAEEFSKRYTEARAQIQAEDIGE
jgi:bacterioferritin (cytochrome b1)